MLDRAWRTMGTGLAFAFIFIGGALGALTLFPLVTFFSGRSPTAVRKLMRRIFQIYLACLQGIGVIKLQIAGRERLERCSGVVVIANHPSLLDVVILISLIPRSQCVVKHQLWNHRLLGPVVRGAGFIRNDLEAEAMIAACRQSLQDGDALIIFPEGTRTPANAAIDFQRGFANLALAAGAALQPVHIDVSPPTLAKGERWWQIPPRLPVFAVEAGEEIALDRWSGLGRGIAVRRIVAEMEQLYLARRLRGGACRQDQAALTIEALG